MILGLRALTISLNRANKSSITGPASDPENKMVSDKYKDKLGGSNNIAVNSSIVSNVNNTGENVVDPFLVANVNGRNSPQPFPDEDKDSAGNAGIEL